MRKWGKARKGCGQLNGTDELSFTTENLPCASERYHDQFKIRQALRGGAIKGAWAWNESSEQGSIGNILDKRERG